MSIEDRIKEVLSAVIGQPVTDELLNDVAAGLAKIENATEVLVDPVKGFVRAKLEVDGYQV